MIQIGTGVALSDDEETLAHWSQLNSEEKQQVGYQLPKSIKEDLERQSTLFGVSKQEQVVRMLDHCLRYAERTGLPIWLQSRSGTK